MKNENLETLKELIDGFDTKYYDKKNEQLEKEISNINMGRPRYEGIYSLIQSRIVPQNQREKEIKKLESEIEDNHKQKRELGQALSQLRMASHELERLVKKDILLSQLDNLISNRTISQQEMRETDIFKESKKEYSKLYLKSNRKIEQSMQQIGKEIYLIIKKRRTYKAYKSINSIGTALELNKIVINDKNDPQKEIESDIKKEYRGFPFNENISQLGVDVNKIKYAREVTKGDLNPESLTWLGKEIFNKLKNIKIAKEKHINIKGGYSKLTEIENKYTELAEMSRETWYLNEILGAFKNTDIIETEMYKGLQELARKQESDLIRLTNGVDKLYEKSGIEVKIDLIEQLEDLYRKTEDLNIKIEQYQNMGNERQVELLKEEYYKLRYDMIKILKENPDLNNRKYNIDIEKIIKKEMEIFEPEMKKETVKEPSYIKTNEQEIFIERTAPTIQTDPEPTIEKTDNIEQISTQPQTKFKEKTADKDYIKDTGKVESLELDTNLQIHRFMHYQNYMREKNLNSDLGKLSFSAYLQIAAPHLTELINIEKDREALARTIYREYVKYYKSLENKENAQEFYEYAGDNYGISNVDVPIECEEEYNIMRNTRVK